MSNPWGIGTFFCWPKSNKDYNQFRSDEQGQEKDDPIVFELPARCRIPQDTIPGATNHTELMQFLGKVRRETGFLEPLLIKLLVEKKFSSIRTSDLAIARGSLKGINERTHIEESRAAFKTTAFGSKSNHLTGTCEGKLPRERRFRTSFNPDNAEETANYDLKDNNALSIFPVGSERGVRADLVTEYQRTVSTDVQQVREFNGLLYFSELVPQTENGASNPNRMQAKHYSQEALTIGALLQYIAEGLYKDPRIISQDGQVYLEFIDDKASNNICRAKISGLILRPYVQADRKLRAEAEVFQTFISGTPTPSFATFQNYFNKKKPHIITALQDCHAPLFAISDVDNFSTVPVMVQAGKNGEGVIRDADFEHFYKHPLTPSIAYKTFNGSSPDSIENFRIGLDLLRIRLQSKTRADFKRELIRYIQEFEEPVVKLELVAFDKLGLGGITYAGPDAKGIISINIEGMRSEVKSQIILAKYNDFSSLRDEAPYINYTKMPYFTEYTASLITAIGHYEANPNDLKTVGESSAHSLVMQRTLDNPMVVHGDEADHPRVKPEKFSRITTCCNGRFIVTKNEEQYLKLLFTNPEIMQQQMIGVHPYWLRSQDLNDQGLPNGTSHEAASRGMHDILAIQALQQGILIAEQVRNTSLMSGFDMYAESVIANMSRSMVKNDGERAFIAEIKRNLTTYFAELKHQFAQTPPDTLREAMQAKIASIYADSPYKDKMANSKYNAYTRSSAAPKVKRRWM